VPDVPFHEPARRREVESRGAWDGGDIKLAAGVQTTQKDELKRELRWRIGEERLYLHGEVCQGIEIPGGIQVQEFLGQLPLGLMPLGQSFQKIPIMHALSLYLAQSFQVAFLDRELAISGAVGAMVVFLHRPFILAIPEKVLDADGLETTLTGGGVQLVDMLS
jgi:hypothetical protein